jgi:succinate dehydrogenase / fumarate reductase cytochrome b subunit
MSDAQRPLSPHLDIYRWQVTMASSILHRATGVGLGGGMLVLAWWLIAAASGADYYEMVSGWLTSIIGRIVLLAFTWALFFHLCNGIRHLFWDIGKGYDLVTATRSAWAVIGASVVLTLVAWVAAYAS